MKKLLTTLFICSALILCSFNAKAPEQQERTVTIVIPVSHVDYILKALAEKPYKESAAIIENIYGQAAKQIQDTTNKR